MKKTNATKEAKVKKEARPQKEEESGFDTD
jgi:hypothetical protein